MRLLATPRSRWLVAAILTLVAFSVVAFASRNVGARDAQLVSYYETGDARKIVVSVGMGVCDDIVETTAVEDAASVRVTVRIRDRGGTCTMGLVFIPTVVELRAVLLDRAVLDGAGRPLRNLGFYRAIPTPTP